MERLWSEILKRYGQEITLHGRQGAVETRAFVQPWPDRGTEQQAPSPLGLGRPDRFRYLGPGRYPLDQDTVVEWNGQDYRVQAAYVMGEGVCPYWWAVLYPREEAAL